MENNLSTNSESVKINGSQKGLTKKIFSLNYIGVVCITILLFIFLSVTQSGFLTPMNMTTLLTTVGVLFVVSMGQTLTVLTRGIDMSVGSNLALVSISLHFFLQSGIPEILSIILAVVVGGMIGLINGILIGPLQLSFFVVTLGAMGLWRGIVYLTSGGKTAFIETPIVLNIGSGTFLGVPVIVIIMVVVLIVSAIILRYTHFGRDVYAVGGNVEAARLSGIRDKRTLAYVYMLCGIFVGIAAIMQTGRIGAASPTIGADLALLTAAAVFLGGTSFKGGVGGVIGTAFGVLFIGVLQNGLGIAGVSSYWQEIITGIILIVAIFMDKLQNNK